MHYCFDNCLIKCGVECLLLFYFVLLIGLYTRKPDGRLLPLKADHDVLNLKENDVVLVEIKD